MKISGVTKVTFAVIVKLAIQLEGTVMQIL